MSSQNLTIVVRRGQGLNLPIDSIGHPVNWGGIGGDIDDQDDLIDLIDNLASLYAPIAKGVTNGDSHDHSGGDGGQINHTTLSNIGTNTHAQIDTHIANTSNPHSVTKAQVGLSNVDDTSDASKPISTLTQAALDLKQTLDSDLTAIAALSPTNDDIIQRKAGAWINRTMAQLKTDLALVKGDVGLGNVDNTSDANKPVSTATQTALDLKEALANKNQSSGYVGIDSSGRIAFTGKIGAGITPTNQFHAYNNDTVIDGTEGILIEQGSTGDASLKFLLTGGQIFKMGIDNSDSDKFKIGTNTDLGSDNLLTLTVAGDLGLGQTTPTAKLEVNNGSGTGTVAYFTSSGILASGKAVVDIEGAGDNTTAGMNGVLYVHSSVNHTGASGRALTKIFNDGATSTMHALDIRQDGVNDAIFVDNNGNSEGLTIDHDDTGTNGSIYIDRDGNNVAKVWGIKMDVDNAGAGGVGALDLSTFTAGEALFKVPADATAGVDATIDGRITIDVGGTLKYIRYYAD